jgi:hypothetical protein
VRSVIIGLVWYLYLETIVEDYIRKKLFKAADVNMIFCLLIYFEGKI